MTDAWSKIVTFVPTLVVFVAVLVIGYLIAKAVTRIARRVLRKVGFDRAVERGGMSALLARTQYDASDLLAKLGYYAILLLTLQIAFGIWGPNPVSRAIDGIVSFLPKAAVAIIIVVVAAAIARAVRDVMSTLLSDLSYGRLLANIASGIVLVLGVVSALDQVGVATRVTLPVLIAVLATIGGTLVVGVGGGMVRPMSHRWESWLATLERETRNVSREVAIRRSAPQLTEDEEPWRASPPPPARAVPPEPGTMAQ